MLARVQKWGKNQGVRLPKTILRKARVFTGDDLKVSVLGRIIILEPVQTSQRKYTLKKLIAKMPKNYKPAELEWGRAMGKEVW